MCLQKASYRPVEHTIYLGKILMKYCESMVTLLDECAGETWFMDSNYKSKLEGCMKVYNGAKHDITNMKHYQKTYCEEQLPDLARRCILHQDGFNEMLVEIEGSAKMIQNGYFRKSCIYDEYRRVGPESLVKYNITFKELMKQLGMTTSGEKYTVRTHKDGRKFLVSKKTHIVCDYEIWLKNAKFVEIGRYDPETTNIVLLISSQIV